PAANTSGAKIARDGLVNARPANMNASAGNTQSSITSPAYTIVASGQPSVISRASAPGSHACAAAESAMQNASALNALRASSLPRAARKTAADDNVIVASCNHHSCGVFALH